MTIEEGVLAAVRIKAARAGQRDSAVVEESLRRDLGIDLLDELRRDASLAEEETMGLALEAQHATRHPKR